MAQNFVPLVAAFIFIFCWNDLPIHFTAARQKLVVKLKIMFIPADV